MILRFCPLCATGLVSSHIAGRERQHCPTCDYIDYRNPRPVAGCLVVANRRIVLVRRAVEPRLGYWALPAGYVEDRESPEEAARRETLEECGLHVELDEMLGIYTVVPPGPEPSLIALYYLAHAVGGTLMAGDDAAEARYFAPDELPTDFAFPRHQQVIAAWRERWGSGSRL